MSTLRSIQPERIDEPGVGTIERYRFAPSEAVLYELLHTLFADHWHEIQFGPFVPGSMWEITVKEPPSAITLEQGEFTVEFGHWHFHLWIGSRPANQSRLMDTVLTSTACTAHVDLFRRLNAAGVPQDWWLRLLDGSGRQQIAFYLPSPYWNQDYSLMLDPPDWSRLALWDMLRKQYLGLDPDPRDRSGRWLAQSEAAADI